MLQCTSFTPLLIYSLEKKKNLYCAQSEDPKQVLSRVYSELKYEFERKSEPVSDEDKHVKIETDKPEEVAQMEAGEVNDEEHAMSDRSSKSPSSLMAFFSCLRGNKVVTVDNDELYETPKPETGEHYIRSILGKR